MRATQLNKAHEITVGERTFSVRKFDIFTNGRITFNIMSTLGPLLGGISGGETEGEGFMPGLMGAL